MIVKLTEKAAGEVRRLLDGGQPVGTMLRIGVAGGGCGGLQYSLRFDQMSDEAKDSVSEQHGIKVVVDKKSALYLDGTEIDYQDGLDRSGFAFHNPNETGSCGCGKSFRV